MKSVQGFFVEANDEQMALIWEAVAANGLTQDSKGILEYLMMCIEEEDADEEEEIKPEPDPIEKIVDHFAKNPAQAEALKQAGARLFGQVFNKFKK